MSIGRAPSQLPAGTLEASLADRGEDGAAGGWRLQKPVVLAAHILAVVAAAASLLGLTLPGVYRDGSVVEAALRGGDLVTLTLVAPALAVAAWLADRGAPRARLVLFGLLGYLSYGYAYYVFTASFGSLFLVHVVVFLGASVALGVGLGTAGNGARRVMPADRVVGGWLLAVGAALLWSFGAAVLRFAGSGEVPTDVLPFPEWRIHLGYAMDLSVTVPASIVAGLGLLRRTAWGTTVGATVCVWLSVFQLNYLVSHLFVADAGIASVSVTDPVPWVTAAIFLIPSGVMLRRAAT